MRHHDIRLSSQELTEQFVRSQDCLLIATDHSAYDYEWLVQQARLIVDTRNATVGFDIGGDKVRKA